MATPSRTSQSQRIWGIIIPEAVLFRELDEWNRLTPFKVCLVFFVWWGLFRQWNRGQWNVLYYSRGADQVRGQHLVLYCHSEDRSSTGIVT